MKLSSMLTRIAIGVPFVWLGYEAVRVPGIRVKMATDFGVPDEYGELAVRAHERRWCSVASR